MRTWLRSRLTYSNLISTLCLGLLLGGTALALGESAGPSAASKLYVCAKKRGASKGEMRLVSQRTRCRRTERKVSWPRTADAPGGQVAFYASSSCPSGWSPYDAARGRYIVGLPAGGQLQGQVGTALSPQENRPVGRHDHTITDPGHSHSADVQRTINAGNVAAQKFQGNAQGGAADQTLSTGSATTGITVNPAGAVDGTNAPYVQLLPCKKD